MDCLLFIPMLVLLAGQFGCGEGSAARNGPSGQLELSGQQEFAGQAAQAESQGWGAITGTFIYDGDAPEPRRITVGGQDAELFRDVGLVDESLLVNKQNGGIRNIAVYLMTEDVDQHESYEELGERQVVLASRNGRLEPHVLAMRTSQKLNITNEDPTGHNIRMKLYREFSGTVPQGRDQTLSFERQHRSPVFANCGVHPWERACILVRDNPYFAVTDNDGKFTIENLPAGEEFVFRVWHETVGPLQARPESERGQFSVVVQPDQTTDLSEIKVSPSMFDNAAR